jgi:hypothetical protein
MAALETKHNKFKNHLFVSATSLAVLSAVFFSRTITCEQKAPRSKIMAVDSEILPRVLKQRGYVAPDTFKAIVIEIVPDADGGFVYYPMDFAGTSKDRDNWWPASTVKLYAATAALERLRAWGFNLKQTQVTYNYEDEGGPVTQPFEQILRRAITDSKNPEFDRLVDIVGSERLNRHFLTEKNGIKNTVMLRCYSGRTPNPVTGKCTNRVSPSIIIKDKRKEKTLPVRTNKASGFVCENEGNCTTLADLTEVMRRVMMHEYLPKSEQFKLGEKELRLLQDALKGKHARGGVADGIRFAFKNREVEIFHKAGYADRWFSDNVFLKIKDTGERWIIAMADRPGRGALDEVSRILAAAVADHTLSMERTKAFNSETVKKNIR